MAKKKKTRYNRKAHIQGREWRWFVGRWNIAFLGPDREKFYASFNDVTGKSSDEIERGQWKGYFSITPFEVKQYLLERLGLPKYRRVETISNFLSDEFHQEMLDSGVSEERYREVEAQGAPYSTYEWVAPEGI